MTELLSLDFMRQALLAALLAGFAAPLVVFDGLKPGAALKASFSVSLKNWAAFTLYGLVLIALFVAAAIPFLLGLLVMAPVAMISVYTAYRDIFRSQSPDGIRLS